MAVGYESDHDADLELQRQRMLEKDLRGRGIHDPRVLRAMAEVPREAFVPADARRAAYADRALPLACGQTISQPFTVAFMCQACQLTGGEKVLEIGTGSGYAAAVLSRLVQHVHTVERIPSLAESARLRLQTLHYDNVTVHCGDGTLGLPQEAPFDVIVVTAGGSRLPPAYPSQITPGGRIVIPLESGLGGQSMRRFTRDSTGLREEDLGRFAFVPLIGRFGWQQADSEWNDPDWDE